MRTGKPGHLGAVQLEVPNDVRHPAALAGACVVALMRPSYRPAGLGRNSFLCGLVSNDTLVRRRRACHGMHMQASR